MSDKQVFSNTTNSNEFLSVKEAALVSSYSTAYVTRLVQKGLIKAVRNGRQWRIDPESLREFVWSANKKKKIRSDELRKKRVSELNSIEQGSLAQYPVSDFHALDFKATMTSFIVTTCFVLMFLLINVYDRNEPMLVADMLVSGVDKLSDDFKGRVFPKTYDLSATSLLSQSVAEYSGNVLQTIRCDLKLLWYKNDICGYPKIEYTIVPSNEILDTKSEEAARGRGADMFAKSIQDSEIVTKEVINKNSQELESGQKLEEERGGEATPIIAP